MAQLVKMHVSNCKLSIQVISFLYFKNSPMLVLHWQINPEVSLLPTISKSPLWVHKASREMWWSPKLFHIFPWMARLFMFSRVAHNVLHTADSTQQTNSTVQLCNCISQWMDTRGQKTSKQVVTRCICGSKMMLFWLMRLQTAASF